VQKGIIFSAEAIYIIVVVFAAILVFLAALPNTGTPDYDTVQTMKVMHDLGEAGTANPPPGYNTTHCSGKSVARLPYYNESLGVCME